MSPPLPPRIDKFPAAKQRRLDVLLDKNGEGKITGKERATLERLVAEAEDLMVANGKRLAAFARRSNEAGKVDSVAVTVWVQPASSER